MDNNDLDDILNGETTEAPEAVAEEPTVEQEAPSEGPVRDEKGRFAPKGETTDAPPASQDEPGHIPIAALKDERSKRQALENELNQLRAQYAQQQQPQVQEQGPPDRWEDPEGYDQWLVNQASQAATSAAREEAERTFHLNRISQSAQAVRAQVPDYDEKYQVFGQMAQVNPSLITEMVQSPNPAAYAYNIGKMQLEISQHGGIEGLINARVAEALSAQQPDLQAQLPHSLPPSVTANRSVGSRSGPAWGGPQSIDDLLK